MNDLTARVTLCVALFIALCASPWSSAEAGALPADAPDIFLVVLDDFGQGYLAANFSASGELEVTPSLRARDAGRYDINTVLQNMRVAMPTVNQLVAQGLRFSQAYATNPLCAPSRLSILTGRHSASFGAAVNYDVTEKGMPPTDAYDYPAEMLQRQGYATAAIGKWHGAETDWTTARRDDPIATGFQRFYGFNQHGTDYYRSKAIWSSDATGQYKKVPQPEGKFLIDQFSNQVVQFQKTPRVGDPPIFVYLAYNAIHMPLSLDKPAPAAYRLFDTGSADADLLLSYMRAVDTGLANILAQQKKRKRFDKTLILFVADNGSPGGSSYVAPANSPYEGYKGQQLEGGLHVPMMASWPGHIAAGKTYSGLVSTMDLIATALSAGGADTTGLDGLPLQRLFAGTWPPGDSHHEHILSFSHNAGAWGTPGQPSDVVAAPGAWLMRTPQRLLLFTAADHYLMSGAPDRGLPRRSLFEPQDAAMQNDLSAVEPGTVLAMETTFWAWFARQPPPAASADWTYWADLQNAAPPANGSRARAARALPRHLAPAAAGQDICTAPASQRPFAATPRARH